MSINPLTATAADLQARLIDGSITSEALVQLYLNQIARHNDYFKAVIATVREDLLYSRAKELDDERAKGTIRGPFHGIPILVKVSYSPMNFVRLLETVSQSSPTSRQFRKQMV
jgi:amidase